MRDESGFATIRGFGGVLVIGGVATVVVVDYGGGVGGIVLDVCYVDLHEGVACAWVSGDLNAAAHLCCGFWGGRRGRGSVLKDGHTPLRAHKGTKNLANRCYPLK